MLEGANAIAGEWGHNPLPLPRDDELPRPACYCGRQVASRPGSPAPPWSRPLRTAAKRLRAEIARGRGVRATLARYEERLARALAGVINLLDPDVIVLGGGMSNIAGCTTRARAVATLCVFRPVDTRLVPPAWRLERRARRSVAVGRTPPSH